MSIRLCASPIPGHCVQTWRHPQLREVSELQFVRRELTRPKSSALRVLCYHQFSVSESSDESLMAAVTTRSPVGARFAWIDVVSIACGSANRSTYYQPTHTQSVMGYRIQLLTYRIIFGLVDVCMSDYFQLMSSNGDRTVTRGNPFKLSVNYCCTNTRKNFFSERVVKVWNSLPPSIVNFASLARFRKSLNNINLRIYTKY